MKTETPNDLEPNKIDSIKYPNKSIYLGSYTMEELTYHLWRYNDKLVVDHIAIGPIRGGTCRIFCYDENQIIENLNAWVVSSLSSKASLISFWQTALQLFKNSEPSMNCECGSKKDYPNSNIGHFRFCNYMKSTVQ